MNKKQNEKIYHNRAIALSAHDHVNCESCFENLVFAMRDNNHDFSLGLSTVLECLNIAEKEGYVPKLPAEWWIDVMGTM